MRCFPLVQPLKQVVMEGKSLTIRFAKRENLGSSRRSLDPGETETKGDRKVHRKTLPTLEFCIRWAQWEEFKNLPDRRGWRSSRHTSSNSQRVWKSGHSQEEHISLWPAAAGQSVGAGAPPLCSPFSLLQAHTRPWWHWDKHGGAVEAPYWEFVRCSTMCWALYAH